MRKSPLLIYTFRCRYVFKLCNCAVKSRPCQNSTVWWHFCCYTVTILPASHETCEKKAPFRLYSPPNQQIARSHEKTPLWPFLSNITRNNEARVSREDDHLTHPLKVKPEEPSGAFYPCQSSVHMKLIDPLKWPSYSINDPNKLNVDGGGGLNMKAITCSTVRACVFCFLEAGFLILPSAKAGF